MNVVAVTKPPPTIYLPLAIICWALWCYMTTQRPFINQQLQTVAFREATNKIHVVVAYIFRDNRFMKWCLDL